MIESEVNNKDILYINHAGDCAVWVGEYCNCEVGKDQRETRESWEHAR